jgi:hypothetical protein
LQSEETKSCKHLEIVEFGVFRIRRGEGGQEVFATLLKCGSCGHFLTLGSELIREEDIMGRAGTTRDNMRTLTVQLNSDIYERIENLKSRESEEADLSKITNELLALGLHRYTSLLPKALE